ncbi:MAG: alpha/beta hydrolase [Parafilimonas sp.]
MNKKNFLLITSLLFVQFVFSQNQNENTLNLAESFPGILVDAGGHKLHLNIQGNGTPTVIFENGTADFSFIWTLVQPEVAKFTKTVSYDRAGYAWSEPGPMPRTSKQICFELHTALMNAGIKPPYILVGQSFGGFIVRAFARYYPKEVMGIVLVEAIQENQRIFMGGDTPQLIRSFAQGRTLPEPQTFFTAQADTSTQAITLNTEIDPLFNKLPDSVQKMQIWAQSQPKFIPAVQAEMDWSPEDVANLYKHTDEPVYMLGNMPLIVLTRGKGGFDGRPDSLQLETERLQAQEALAHLSSNSKHIIDMNSGHNIHVEDPDTVIEAIKEVYAAVTKHKQLKQ